MQITRDVITDLLPLYFAGEASTDTRALLEEYLRQHPDFATAVRAQAERSAALLSGVVAAPSPDLEKTTFQRVRRFNRTRHYLLVIAVTFLLLPLSFKFENNQVTWIMLRDSPTQAAGLWFVALGCWTVYRSLGRRLA